MSKEFGRDSIREKLAAMNAMHPPKASYGSSVFSPTDVPVPPGSKQVGKSQQKSKADGGRTSGEAASKSSRIDSTMEWMSSPNKSGAGAGNEKRINPEESIGDEGDKFIHSDGREKGGDKRISHEESNGKKGDDSIQSGGDEEGNVKSAGPSVNSGDEGEGDEYKKAKEQDSEDEDDEEEFDEIDQLRSLTPGRAFIDGALRLTVIKAPVPALRNGGRNKVTNITLEDEQKVKARLVLWGNDADEYQPRFAAALGQQVLLSEVRLSPIDADFVKYAPDPSFPNELLLKSPGKLKLDTSTVKAQKFEKLSDFVGLVGNVEGRVRVKVGRGIKEESYLRSDYKTIIVHNGQKRLRIIFGESVVTSNIKKSAEVILKKLRLKRDSDVVANTVCFIDSNADFEMVLPNLREMDQVPLKTIPDLFDVEPAKNETPK